MIQLDWLHLVELGVGQDVCGNLLWEVLRVEGVLEGRSLKTRLAALNALLQEHNRVHKPSNPIGRLTMAMVKAQGQPPKLKSKGAECRHLQPFVLKLAGLLVDHHHAEEKFLQMMSVADALVACSKAVDADPFCLARFQELGDSFLKHYIWLNQNLGQDGVLWRLYPKHHMFWHLLHTVAPRNGSPRDYWNWRDESFGGQLALVAKRRGGKAIPSHVAWELLQRVAALGWVGA